MVQCIPMSTVVLLHCDIIVEASNRFPPLSPGWIHRDQRRQGRRTICDASNSLHRGQRGAEGLVILKPTQEEKPGQKLK